MTETSILPLINRIAAASSIDDAWALATGYFAALGFGRANYGFTRFKHLKTLAAPERQARAMPRPHGRLGNSTNRRKYSDP